MSLYRIALLPENEKQWNNLQKLLEILEKLNFSASYTYPIYPCSHSESRIFFIDKEWNLIKNTTCCFIAPDYTDWSGKGKYYIADHYRADFLQFCKKFRLHTQMYSCRIFTEENQTSEQDIQLRVLSPIESVGYERFQIKNLSNALRKILEEEQSMSNFANLELDDLCLNVQVFSRTYSQRMLSFANKLNNGKTQIIILHEHNKDNPYFQEELKNYKEDNWATMNILEFRQWLQSNNLHQAIVVGNPSLVDWIGRVGLKMADCAYIGDAYGVFSPTAMNWPNCSGEISSYLSLILSSKAMLDYLQEQEKSQYLMHAFLQTVLSIENPITNLTQEEIHQRILEKL